MRMVRRYRCAVAPRSPAPWARLMGPAVAVPRRLRVYFALCLSGVAGAGVPRPHALAFGDPHDGDRCCPPAAAPDPAPLPA